MAKKSATGNKSQAIRDALKANADASPKQIAEIVAAQGHQVTPAYVSIVKYNLSKSSGAGGRTVRVKRRGAPSSGGAGNGVAPIQAALEFIQACGGLDQAKQVLATVEQLRSVV